MLLLHHFVNEEGTGREGDVDISSSGFFLWFLPVVGGELRVAPSPQMQHNPLVNK